MVIVTQRERFGMTEESLGSFHASTENADLVHVDGNSPKWVADYLEAESKRRGFAPIREERFLTPNQARDLGVAAASTDHVVFADDVLHTPGRLERPVARADETGAGVVRP